MSKADLVVRQLPESEYADWDRLVADSPSGSAYSRTDYLDALCSASEGNFRVLVAQQNNTLLGGVALYERSTRWGIFVSPRLLLYYNGVVLARNPSTYPSEQTARTLKVATAIAAELTRRGYANVRLKSRPTLSDVRPFLADGWAAVPGYTYVVDITDLERTRSRIEHNLRRLIDRNAREGVACTEDTDFPSFFQLHMRTMERVDFRAYLDEAAFRRYFDLLAQRGLARLYHARLSDGRAIASQLVLLGHPVTHTVSAAADPDYLKSGVSAFLRWKAFEHLSALGHTANDLTDAALNPVTHFKSQLGGELQPWFELGSPPTLRWTLAAGAEKALGGARSVAGGLARRILRR